MSTFTKWCTFAGLTLHFWLLSLQGQCFPMVWEGLPLHKLVHVCWFDLLSKTYFFEEAYHHQVTVTVTVTVTPDWSDVVDCSLTQWRKKVTYGTVDVDNRSWLCRQITHNFGKQTKKLISFIIWEFTFNFHKHISFFPWDQQNSHNLTKSEDNLKNRAAIFHTTAKIVFMFVVIARLSLMSEKKQNMI